ncbi:hypothetical protein IV102_29715 [bacterium]|nr:hypothetical protein [bacterium]
MEHLEEIRVHLKSHDQRFDAMDQRFDAMDQRFDAMDRRFDSMEGMIRGVGVQTENLQSTVQLLAEQMSSFLRTTGDMRARVECLEEKQSSTEFRLKILERRANQ